MLGHCADMEGFCAATLDACWQGCRQAELMRKTAAVPPDFETCPRSIITKAVFPLVPIGPGIHLISVFETHRSFDKCNFTNAISQIQQYQIVVRHVRGIMMAWASQRDSRNSKLLNPKLKSRGQAMRLALKHAALVQAYAAMIGDSPAADARGKNPGPDKSTKGRRRVVAGALSHKPGAPLPQPGHEFKTSSWLFALLRHVCFQWGSCV